MTAMTPLAQRIHAEFVATPGAGDADTLARRQRLLEATLQAGLPSTRDDNFKYAPLRVLEKLRFAAAPAADEAATSRAATLLPAPLPGFDRCVFIDGRFCAALSSAALAGASRGAMPFDAATDGTSQATRRFAMLNASFAAEAWSFHVPASAQTTRLELVFVSLADGSAGASYPRVVIDTDTGSALQLVERHLGATDGAGFCNASIELALGSATRCDHYRLQTQGLRCTHLESLRCVVQVAAHYTLHDLQLGAASSRSSFVIELAGRDAALTLHAANAASGTQVHDSQVIVEHRAPSTRTRETFRGLIDGRARVAFNGHMIVRDSAPGADTQQSLRALLAGADTEADLRPQLEIYTDDVKASHGATAGKLDENMLFYLLSRGIEHETAQSLLKWAFMAEVLTRIDIPQLRAEAQQLVIGRVQGLIGEALA